MSLLFVFAIWSILLCAYYDTLQLRKNVNNSILYINDNNNFITASLPTSNKHITKHLYFSNKVFERGKKLHNSSSSSSIGSERGKRKVHLDVKKNDGHKNEIIIEKFKSSSGNDVLCTKLFINDEENKFILDLCSDNSYIFDKGEKVSGRRDIRNENYGIHWRDRYNKEHHGNDHMHFSYDNDDIQSVKEEIHLNDNKVLVDKVINMKSNMTNGTVSFYIIRNNELGKNFDGLIGFDFFKRYSGFMLDMVSMNIVLKEEDGHAVTGSTISATVDASDRSSNNAVDAFFKNNEQVHEIKLYDYSNNIKYFHVNIEGQMHKGIIDTGSSNTMIVNSENTGIVRNEKDEEEKKKKYNSVIIENILNNKCKAQRVQVNNINIISKLNELIPIELKSIYKSELDYLDANIVLLGLDFLENKKIFFDLKNNIILYYYNMSSASSVDMSKDNQNSISEREDSYTYNMNSQHDAKDGSQWNSKQSDKHIDDLLVERKCQEIFEKLKRKELSFLKITNELEKENIYIKDCKTTNDVIKRYAIKILYGSEFLKKNESTSGNKEFDIRYNEMINFFKKLSNDEKQNMLHKIVAMMKNDIRDYEKASEILEKFVTYEIKNNLYSLHRFKSNNVNKKNEQSLNDEYNHLYNLYTSHPEYSFEMLNDFKKELLSRRIKYDDCQDEKEIIKRVSKCRVYEGTAAANISSNINNSGNGNKNKKRKNIIVRRYTNDDNNVHTQIIIRRNGIDSNDDSSDENDGNNDYQYGNMDKMDDLFPNSIFSGIFKNFFGDNRNENNQDETDEEGQNDLFSELNNFFGLGNMGENMFRKKKKKSVIGFKTKEPDNTNIDNKDGNTTDNLSEAIKEEKDVDIIYLLNKVQKLNDINLKNFIVQSLKNQNVRKILVDALKKGYHNTYEQCRKENDNKSMYLLQMLKQSGIF
ncbi:conserved Plasmodium protein, unknown function [Plasmodium malariae]|uniref:Aspartyl protease n=1 Tax=Plasmodium malariae TaxID=5858 RepID=A0A1A8VS30_PLAMA|nr:conserved Plasmodium protein, unknown function [Plasmodium malariae]SBS83279.1 conserved Plasmodium protein, unknown function [Plasmodium malariae]SCN45031.1 conserved Plasmodium protein, unknown function [Plasmodium malariae]